MNLNCKAHHQRLVTLFVQLNLIGLKVPGNINSELLFWTLENSPTDPDEKPVKVFAGSKLGLRSEVIEFAFFWTGKFWLLVSGNNIDQKKEEDSLIEKLDNLIKGLQKS